MFLIITYYSLPCLKSVGTGCMDLPKVSSEYGWNPTLLTPILPGEPDPQFHVIQAPCDEILQWKKYLGLNPKKTLNAQLHVSKRKNSLSILDHLAYYPWEIISYPDCMKGWYKHAVRAGDRFLQSERVDAILSSSFPVTCSTSSKAPSQEASYFLDRRSSRSLDADPYSNHCAPRRLLKDNLKFERWESKRVDYGFQAFSKDWGYTPITVYVIYQILSYIFLTFDRLGKFTILILGTLRWKANPAISSKPYRFIQWIIDPIALRFLSLL